MRALVLAAVLAVTAGCDAAEARAPDAGRDVDATPSVDATDAPDVDVAPTSDAGLVEPAAPETDFVLELGLGHDAFRLVRAGDEAPLQRGCQGAQHVSISLRSPNLAPGELAVTLFAVRIRDDAEVVPAYTVVLPWDAGAAGAELIGLTLVMFDPDAVVGEVVDVHAEVQAPDGRVGRAVMRVQVAWGPDAC